MKQVNWESVLGQIDDDILQEAIGSCRPAGSVRSIPRKILFLAAAIALIFTLGVTAYAANLFGIRDMLMELSGKTYITTAGYQDSNEYKALMEWEACRPQRQQWHGSEDPIHHQYGAYTPAAKKALDAILEKYDLQLHDEWAAVYDGDPQSLYDAVGADGFLPESCAAYRGTTNPDVPGCSVRNGVSIYSFSDSTLLPNGTQVNYELTNCAKGYMPIFIGLNVDLENVTQWYYTVDGTSVLLFTDDPAHGGLIVDLDRSFLTVSFTTPVKQTLTREDMEAFADMLDYKTISQIGNSP